MRRTITMIVRNGELERQRLSSQDDFYVLGKFEALQILMILRREPVGFLGLKWP